MKISVIGCGYVGLSIATLLSRKHEIVAIDIDEDKVKLINSGISPIADEDIEKWLSSGDLNLKATLNLSDCAGSEYVIIATPTNYDPDHNHLNTESVEDSIRSIEKICPDCTIVIKSTVPIGFTKEYSETNGFDNIIYSPEFLKEGSALNDCLHPSRIVAGVPSKELEPRAKIFIDMIKESTIDVDVKTMVMGSAEAESVKLFSNMYLAMRVAYFNELDSFALLKGLNSKEIIEGICADPRIGDYYNNPSFGYGGYCLPKDTKQLLSNYSDVPNRLMEAVITSNAIRKKTIMNSILETIKDVDEPIVGIFRLVMKSNSDNYRESSIVDIMDGLSEMGVGIRIYEPTLVTSRFKSHPVVEDLNEFKGSCDLIVTNRMSHELDDVESIVFCRDVFQRD